jgi:hypothetical protein
MFNLIKPNFPTYFYKTVSIPVFPVASMLISALVIVCGLRWNHFNISTRKRIGTWVAWPYSFFIYTFSLLSWQMIAIFWAELSVFPLATSFVFGWLSITCSQEGKTFRYHPFYFGLLSALVPIITLPSLQGPEQSTRETKTEEEEIPMLPSNTTSESNVSKSSTEGLPPKKISNPSVNESDNSQQQLTPGNS